MNREEFDRAAQEYRVLNIIVRRDGETVFRADYDDEIRRNQYSVTKSFTSAAVGIAQKEGLLSLDERLTDAFRDDLPAHVSENLRQATVRDLLTMCLGQDRGFLMGEQRPFLPETDWVKYSLALPFVHAPGTVFQYNNVGPYLAGVLVQRRAGCTLDRYLTPRLFAPLGIIAPTWETDPMGYSFGAGGLFLCVSELLRFGELLLAGGKWNGRQLIPADYIAEASSKQVENGGEGYGYLFWRGAHNTYRADGKYGQYAIVLPDDNAVIAVNAECRPQHLLLDFLMREKALLLGLH
ncbi:serine hydrolase domain-containing protein [Anaeromassilibacillus senegalensis]|uniref:Serine hydrolase n=1 Tax=Anaeromassilibacillus senegalensis TaxID=1673717 RepID=A0ABS9CPU3_9FIRM|nr:serine hydrolase [Anaeromassilibacillus senegalensis]MCF2652381.1 serine hydrolase [Anaeromassilibacillus senegalensis]